MSRQRWLTAELAPGGETSIDLTVLDATGAPVEDAELAVVIVDEAILALTNYTHGRPGGHLLPTTL